MAHEYRLSLLNNSMPFSVITPSDLFSKHSPLALPVPSAGMLLVQNAVIDPEYCSAYHADTGNIIPESVVRKGPSLGINPRIKRQIDVRASSSPGGASCPVVDKSILLPLPFQGGNHFGHLITEVAAMLYPIIANHSLIGDSMPVFLGKIPWRKSSTYHNALQNCLSPTIIEHALSPVFVKNLFIPLPTLYLRHSFSVFHGLALRIVLPVLFRDMSSYSSDGAWLPSVKYCKKIYLSRSRLGSNNRKICNEEKLENQLEAQGWEIIHPQLLPISQQIFKLAEARVVAGCLGSAFHLLQYLNLENLAQKTILSIALNESHYLNYALQHSAENSASICALALSRDQSVERTDINQDLILDVENINPLLSWLCCQ